jgi:cytochrome P450/NADPH-cytochrome P450 reductase
VIRYITSSATDFEQVVISCVGPTSLPVGKPVKVWEVLTGYVELAQPATTQDLGTLARAATTDSTKSHLQTLKESHAEAVAARRLSVLQILEDHLDIDITFGAFLQLLPAMRVRQYSISSSPLWNPSKVTITISVVASPAMSGTSVEPFLGVGSNYLASLRPGDRVQLAVRPSAAAFHPPSDPRTPVVMFCAGSGIAPMRGFIQDRAIQKATGRDVGKMILFFGCRDPEKDFLYSDTDLAEWIKLGVVEVRPAFSCASADSSGCKYVQE